MVFNRFLLVFLASSVLLQSCSTFSPDAEPVFVGSKTCIECHETEYNLWVGSDHDHAMDTAIVETVLGDFNNVTFRHNGFDHEFYMKDGVFYVYTLGPGGKAGEFQIDYTFGVRPLQQYLVPFEKGRYQVLPLTWDTERKVWYHIADSVYKDQPIHPDDWLYWTNNGQNWNGMCAECHSTNLQKNYDPETHRYNTTWSEMDVSCEACHGPALNHNEWASIDSNSRPDIINYGLVVQTSNISSRNMVEQCAFCHSRRTSFEDFIHPRKNLFDVMSPQLPLPPYYFVDGQILEEDYVYASFTQSKMHQNNVRCNNCHDVHSLKLRYEGNQLCHQCHKKEKYDTYNHHFHKKFNEEGYPLYLGDMRTEVEIGEGSLCVNCHMAGRYFMGIDYRRDHSMRVPRPDLSEKSGTPNACNQCHTDKTTQWASGYVKKWYGDQRPFHFAETMLPAQQKDTGAATLLYKLINSEQTSPLIKATATSYLYNYKDKQSLALINKLIADPDPLVRREAIRSFIPHDLNDLIQTLTPLLADSTRMVRMEAANMLAGVSPENFDSIYEQLLKSAIKEYISSNLYSADFAASRHNLGNIYRSLGEDEKAIKNYKEAFRIDNLFYPAKVNLAMLYNRMGENTEAEKLFKAVLLDHPEMGDIHYSLGLLLAEMKKYDEAVRYFKNAIAIIPENARVHYNLGQLQDYFGEMELAESSLKFAAQLEPDNHEFSISLIRFYLKHEQFSSAKQQARFYKESNPNDQSINQVIEYIENQMK